MIIRRHALEPGVDQPVRKHVCLRLLTKLSLPTRQYASAFGAKKDLALPPARGFAILTCMDARLDPAKFAGLSEGDAHVIRNAGGRASDDAIRSLVISHKLLGTREWFVIHHTNCGMELFTDDVMGDLLDDNLETATLDGNAWSNPKHGHGASAGQFVKWHTIKDQPSSVVQDVRRIREHPLVAKHIPIYGYIYDVRSGNLVEVRKRPKPVDHVREVLSRASKPRRRRTRLRQPSPSRWPPRTRPPMAVLAYLDIAFSSVPRSADRELELDPAVPLPCWPASGTAGDTVAGGVGL